MIPRLRLFLNRLTTHLRPLGHAWLDELLGLLPAGLRTRLAGGRPRRVGWPLPDSLDPALPVVLELGPDQAMAQTLDLPLAATRDLSRVLTYEMDRYTPYPAAAVHFVARLVQTHPHSARVLLVAVARERLQAMLDGCAGAGVTVKAIDVLDAAGQSLQVDLLPPSGARRQGPSRRLAGLGWSLAVLALAVALLEMHRHQVRLDDLRSQVEAQRAGVDEVLRLRQRLANGQDAAAWLGQAQAAQPTASRVLAELTACLGADTWLEQLELRDGQVSFSGQTPRASLVLQRLKGCPSLAGAQFQGVIQADPTTGRERFSITAPLAREATHATTLD